MIHLITNKSEEVCCKAVEKFLAIVILVIEDDGIILRSQLKEIDVIWVFKMVAVFSRFFKRERIKNQIFMTFLSPALTLNLTSIQECYRCPVVDSFSFEES